MSDLLVSGGTVVTAQGESRADVLIEDGKIVRVGLEVGPAARTIDASGLMVMPGAVDSHVHLAHPIDSLGITTADGFFDGSVAGACGGVTTFIDFALQRRGESLADAVERRLGQIRDEAVIDYGVHVIVTDPRPDVLAEIPGLVGGGFPSIKLFMTYGDKRVGDGDLVRILEASGAADGLVFIHCENDGLVTHLRAKYAERGDTGPHYHARSRPPVCEEEAVHRALALAGAVEAPVFIGHVTTRGAVESIRRARGDGQPAFGETCPHYLTLTDDVYSRTSGFEAAKYVCSPPIRSEVHQAAVWEGLEDGTLSQVSSDHAPFRFEDQKALGRRDFRDIPNGLPGIETRLPLLWTSGVSTGRISASRFVDLVSTAPARLFGLYPRKGSLDAGSDGDLVILNPERVEALAASRLHSAVDHSPYEGMRVSGAAAYTISRGEVVWDGHDATAERGRGLLAERGTPDLSRPGAPRLAE